MKMTTIFSADALLYYILEIYDCSQPLFHEMETKIYSRDEIKEIIYSVCNAVKFCHSMNIYHNNISIYNIYAKDNVYRLGKISTNKKLYPNSTDISAETDIAMICRFIGEIAYKLKINKKMRILSEFWKGFQQTPQDTTIQTKFSLI